MNQQPNQITDVDLQMLLAQNPLAAEQLRRIVAERLLQELQSQLSEANGKIVDQKVDIAEFNSVT